MTSDLTLGLLRVVGSPFIPETERPQGGEVDELYAHAVKNKISLLYLEALKKQGGLAQLEALHEEQWARYGHLLASVARVCRLLCAAGVEHVVFKSLPGYPAIPNDVDLLCLGPDGNHSKAMEAMLQEGYRRPATDKAVSGPRTDLLQDPETGYLIDVQKEIGANHLIYFDRKRLKDWLDVVNLYGQDIETIKPQADLAITIGHSVIPEQLYTLAEGYTTLYQLAKMAPEGMEAFVRIVRENRLTVAAKAHLTLTATLHHAAWGAVPDKLTEVLAELGGERWESRRLVTSGFRTPHRFGLLTMFRALAEKAREREARRSIVRQIASFATEPNNTRILIKEILWRRRRESY